jgi:hypothetical protein
VRITKASASELLMKRRNNLGDIETRESFRLWDESVASWFIAFLGRGRRPRTITDQQIFARARGLEQPGVAPPIAPPTR